MKLFKIIVLHGAPRDSHTSVETYLIADSEDAVCEWINKTKKRGDWFEEEDDTEPRMCFEDDSYEKGIPFREWVVKNRGDLKDDEGWEDAYYGVKKWGWEPIEASTDDMATLLRLGIAQLGY
jgi:hypothetical protein